MRRDSSNKFPPYIEVIEKCASSIERPEDRLRFLKSTITGHDETLERVKTSSSPVAILFESRFLRWILNADVYRDVFEELRRVAPENREEWRRVWMTAPRRARLIFQLYQSRYIVYSSVLVVVIAGLVGATAIVRRTGKSRASAAASAGLALTTKTTQHADGTLAGWPYREERVWLVEKTADYERYSNGGRILTKFEVENHPRAYVSFKADGRLQESATTQPASLPVGIIYHSSESDILPFTSDNSESIQAHSEGLAAYVRRNRSYNYLIDRYGEIYRIVRDDQAANHAGYSVWSDGEHVYIGLNESFIGICFESSSAEVAQGSQPEANVKLTEAQMTEAQITSGRALTGILRSRFQIADANCTTHGLVSIDPQRGTIAHHHDWVHGFPFAAFNLSDKYAIAPPSIAVFGFDADVEVMEKLGNDLWQGARKGQNDVIARAEREGVAVGEWRKRQRELFAKGQDLVWSLRRAPARPTEAANSPPSPATAVDSTDKKDAPRNGER